MAMQVESAFPMFVKHLSNLQSSLFFNPTALKKAKIVNNFGLSECNWVTRSSKGAH